MRRVAFLLAGLFLVACGGSSSSSKPLNNAGPPEVAQAPAKPSFTVDDAIRILPPATTVVMGADVAALSAAPILSPYREKLIAQVPMLDQVSKTCGVDLTTDIDWILVGMASGEDGVFIVSGAFTRQVVGDCFRELSKQRSVKLTVKESDGIEVWSQGGDEIRMFWPAPSVVVFSAGDNVELIETSKEGLGLGADLTARVAGADRTAAIWAAGRAPDVMGADAPGFDTAVHAGSWLEIAARADFGTEAKALEAETSIKMGISMMAGQPMLKGLEDMIEGIQLGVAGVTVSMSVRLSADDLEKLEEVLKGAAGMF